MDRWKSDTISFKNMTAKKIINMINSLRYHLREQNFLLKIK